MTTLGTFVDPSIPPAQIEEEAGTTVETTTEIPTGQAVEHTPPTEVPVHTELPTETPAATEPPAQTISFEEQFKSMLGMSPSDLEVQLKELATLKQRPVLEDAELLPDDDFLKDFIKAYKRGGNKVASDYLLAATADYMGMSHEQILKQDVRLRNPGASDFILEAEYKKELRNLGWVEDMEAGSPEDKLFSEYLSYKANQLRTKFSEEAKKFQIPERKESPTVDDTEAARLMEEYRNELMSHQSVKVLQQAKAVSIGGFSLAVEPERIAEMILDSSKLIGLFQNQDGSQNIDKMLKWYALAPDPDKAIELASNAAVAKAKVEWLRDLKNPSTEPLRQAPATGPLVRLIS